MRVLVVLLLAVAGSVVAVPAVASSSPQSECLVAGPPCSTSWWHSHCRTLS